MLIHKEYGQLSGLTTRRDSVSVVRGALEERVLGREPVDGAPAVSDEDLAAHLENLAQRVTNFDGQGWPEQVRLSPYLIALREALEANRRGG